MPGYYTDNVPGYAAPPGGGGGTDYTGLIVGAGGALLGAAANYFGTQDANRTAINLANTSYQRSSRDMLKAGLNPMMMYMKGGGPAGTPDIKSTGPGLQEGLTNSARMAGLEIPLMRSQVGAQGAAATRDLSTAKANDATARLTDAKTTTEGLTQSNLQMQFQQGMMQMVKLKQELDANLPEEQRRQIEKNLEVMAVQMKQLQSQIEVNQANAKAATANAGYNQMLLPLYSRLGDMFSHVISAFDQSRGNPNAGPNEDIKYIRDRARSGAGHELSAGPSSAVRGRKASADLFEWLTGSRAAQPDYQP